MNKMKEYKLENNKTLTFFIDKVKEGKKIANEILKFQDLQNGSFFTFLPTNISYEKLYDFRNGGLLKENPIEEIVVLDQKYKAREKPKLNNELSLFIFNELLKNNKLSSIFEDYLSLLTDPHLNLFNRIGLSYENEIYYLIDKRNLDRKLILDCIKEIDLAWHSVVILSEINLEETSTKKITEKQISEICKQISCIIIGAYDGEGYVFWKR